MEQKADRLNPSAPLENIDLEQRLEKKFNVVNSFNYSINNIIESLHTSKMKTTNRTRNIKNIKQ